MDTPSRSSRAVPGPASPRSPAEIIFDECQEMLCLLDEAGVIIDANPALCESLGFTVAELCGRTVFDIDPGWGPEEYAALFEEVHLHGARRFASTHRRADGSEYPAEIKASPAVEGGVRYLVGASREITNARAVQRQRDLLRAVMVLVIESSSRREILPRVLARIESDLEARGAAIWGPVTPAAGEFEPLFESGAPDLASGSAHALVATAWATQATVWHDRWLALPIGVGDERTGVLHVDLATAPPPELREQLEGTFLSLAQTLSAFEQRRASEEALKIRNRAMEASIDGIAIASVDHPDLALIYVNEGFERITGYSFEEAVGRNCRFLQGPETSDEARAEVRAALAARRATRVTILNYRKDRTTFWNDLQLAPVEDDDGVVRHFVALQHDITERIDIERDLVEARQRATSASRAKSRFLANMSHELRSPMTAILGFADAIARESIERRTIERVATIRRNADYLLQLIGDILDISRIESGKLRLSRNEVDLVALIADVRDLMGVRAEQKSMPLHFLLEGPIPARVTTAPTRLRQILVNLVANAIKFTEEGDVRVTVSALPSGPEAVILRIVVEDTGIGIAADAIDRIFQPFSRPHEVSDSLQYEIEGAGLGLAIVKRLLKQLGGHIDVTSEPGIGSRFELVLPCAVAEGTEWTATLAAPAPAVAAVDDDPIPDLSDATILVADDRPDVAAVVEFYLSDAGATVFIATNGAEVLEAYRAEPDQFDAIVLDMQMPVMDGFEAAQRLRAEGYEGPIVALTAGATKEDEARCLAVGCTSFLSKPAEEIDLLRAVQAAITPTDH